MKINISTYEAFMKKIINVGITGWLLIVPSVVITLVAAPPVFVWALTYCAVIWLFVKTQKTMLDRGVMVVFSGAIIAVAGKTLIEAIVPPSPAFDSYEMIESFFQMMIMMSGGLGGGLISHHVITEEKAPNA